MRLEPLEIYILDCFRQRRTTRLSMAEIVGDTTANRYTALAEALHKLEFIHGVLQRGTRKDVYELTALGMKYTGMVAC